MRKKKIFLGGYLNYTNAQNLNCLSLARHLDKDKFDIYALTTHFGDNHIEDLSIKLFHCFRPFICTKYFGFIWGILNCEILYFPKHQEMPVWILRLVNLLRKNIFTTIEGNMCNNSYISMLDNFGGKKYLTQYFKHIPNIFGITEHLIHHANCGVDLHPTPLYLGVEREMFAVSKIRYLSNIVFIGSLIKRKGVDEILDIAFHFENITFHIIGGGSMREELEERSTNNMIFYGKLAHNEIEKVLNKADLNILLSRSEGFPKVILETASAGVPSIVYSDYGADEWIENNVNGFVLNTKEEVFLKIKELIDKPELLITNSEKVIKLAEKFSWKKQIKVWEQEIERLR